MLCSDNDFVACICVQTCTGDLECDQSNSCLILLFSPPYCIVWSYFVLVIRTKLCFTFPSCSLSQTICQLLPNTAFSVYWKLKGFFFKPFSLFLHFSNPFPILCFSSGEALLRLAEVVLHHWSPNICMELCWNGVVVPGGYSWSSGLLGASITCSRVQSINERLLTRQVRASCSARGIRKALPSPRVSSSSCSRAEAEERSWRWWFLKLFWLYFFFF